MTASTKRRTIEVANYLDALLKPLSPDDLSFTDEGFRPHAAHNASDDTKWIFIYWFEGKRYIVGFDWELIQRRDSARIVEIFEREKLVDHDRKDMQFFK
jgi:hypothetical protein